MLKQRLKRAVKTLLGKESGVFVDTAFMIQYVAKCMTPMSVYVEFGAFTGLTGKWFREMSGISPSHCYLVEACPTNYDLMKTYCAGFHLFNLAVSGQEGTLPFYIVDRDIDEGTSRSNSFDRRHLEKRFGKENVKEIQIRALTVASFLRENAVQQVDFMFFNIEGAEYAIFEGDISFLDQVQYLYLDLHQLRNDDSTLKKRQLAIYDRIIAQGYERLAGHRREDIPRIEDHLSFLWVKR